MIISSRTPEGDSNWCPLCDNASQMEPSCTANDATCPHCGHLLWYPHPDAIYGPFDFDAFEEVAEFARPTRFQNLPVQREPEIQAARLVERLLRRGEERLGRPSSSIVRYLKRIHEPYTAERLLSLLSNAKSWRQLIRLWEEELTMSAKKSKLAMP